MLISFTSAVIKSQTIFAFSGPLSERPFLIVYLANARRSTWYREMQMLAIDYYVLYILAILRYLEIAKTRKEF